MNSPVTIDSAFPGGNIVVERQAGDEFWVHQDLRDSAGPWFYWCFRARGAAGRTLTFHFTQSAAIGVRGPAVSLDQGTTWRWLKPVGIPSNDFTFSFPAAAPDVRFSCGMPYQESHWRAFVAKHGANPSLAIEELCQTPKGRSVECARFGCLRSNPVWRVAITCRHHCCEMMANYVLEGVMDFVLDQDGAEAQGLRSQIEFLVVPFVDKDGVEDGDQGKNRRPHDHGRDYVGESVYASVRALRRRLPAWSDGRLAVALDLHCPCLLGKYTEDIYLVGSPVSRIAERQAAFSRLLESVRRGPLPFTARDFLPFGVDWNVSSNYGAGKGFARWAGELPDIHMSTGIEIPYANVKGAEVNQATARAFGMDLARALALYIKSEK